MKKLRDRTGMQMMKCKAALEKGKQAVEGVKEKASTPTPTAAKVPPVVFVIDDDASVRAALRSLVRSVGLRVEVFASASEFLATKRTDGLSCLILDVRLPGVSGLHFQAELAKANNVIPIIFITGHGDIPMAVEAMQQGAFDFLQKPFEVEELIDRKVPLVSLKDSLDLGTAAGRLMKQGRKPTTTMADRPRRQPPGPANSSGSGPCAWPQGNALSSSSWSCP